MGIKNTNVQFLRGIASLMVFLSHIVGIIPSGLTFKNIDLSTTPLRMFWGGNAGVIIFFVLSGFFQYKDEELTLKKYLNLIYKRHKRVYPVFIIAITIGILARYTCPQFNINCVSNWIGGFWTGNASFKELLLNYVLVSGFDSHLIDPVIWTLRIEMRMIFVIPFIMHLIKKCDKPIFVFIIYAFSLVLGFFVSALSFLSVFTIGIVLKKIILINNKKGSTFIRCICVIIGVILLDFEYIMATIGLKVPSVIIYNFTAVGTAFLLFVLYTADNYNNVAVNLLSKLGDISFEFYLTHFIVILWFRFLLSYIPIYIYGLIVFVISCLIAYALNRYDKIIQKLLKKYESRIFGG